MSVTDVRVRATSSIEAHALWHHYAPGRGLQPVSFAVHGPAVVAVTGPNGSGKSTLLRIMMGLLRPSGGTMSLEVAGRRLSPDERRRTIGYATPELMFYEEMSTAENLRFVCEARGIRDAEAAVGGALERVGLGRNHGDLVSALSSGMRQRLRIAFALLERPAILLLDEPGGHLDARGNAVVAEVVAEQRRDGLVILATNDEREMALAEQRIELAGHHLGDPS